MLQKAAQELRGCQGAAANLAAVGLAIAKGDFALFNLEDALVGNGHPENVGGQIAQRQLPITHSLGMDYPIGSPALSRELVEEGGLLQAVPELGPEEAGEGSDRHPVWIPGYNNALYATLPGSIWVVSDKYKRRLLSHLMSLDDPF